jgi:23S rRNA pseudouridine2457 synthase
MDARTQRYSYYVFYKPYGVLSQFSSADDKNTLANFGPFPSDVYPVGRLDADSEGLLLLTNDNAVKHRLTDPSFDHPKTYLVQVERIPGRSAVERIGKGVLIERRMTKPARVVLLDAEPSLPPRSRPIRFRKNVPTAWLSITLTEGRNRQIRKMTAAVGHPSLRIVRVSVGPLSLSGLQPGAHRALTPDEIDSLRNSLNLPRD